MEISSFGKTILFLHKVAHREVSVSRCPLREKHRIVKPEKFVTLEIKHDPKTPAHSILPPSLWRLLNKKSYLSARLDLGSILLRIRAQDMMAPPFSIGLWGLSKDKIRCLFFKTKSFTFPVQANLVKVSSTGFVSCKDSFCVCSPVYSGLSPPMYWCTCSCPSCWRQTP